MPVALERHWWHRLMPRKWPQFADMPTYEAALSEGLTGAVQPGSKVVVVGAGVGVTVVTAAKLAGPTGQVTCFEGSANCLAQTKETLALNEITSQIDLVHAIVGEDISVYDSTEQAEVLSAENLPECDVLELDCEGAEIKILSEMKIRPQTILVETHGVHGAPTAKVEQILLGLNYVVKNLGVAEPYLADYCQEHDIFVLWATKET
jgi:hypothetical protein